MKSTTIANVFALVSVGATTLLLNPAHATAAASYEGDWWKTESDSDDIGGGGDDSGGAGGGGGVKGAKSRKVDWWTTETDSDDIGGGGDDDNDSTAAIIGGTNATRGEFPGFARPRNTTICGAQLIAPDILITAAHCNDFPRGFPIGGTVAIGALKADGSDAAEVRVIDSFVEHPGYRRSSDPDGFSPDNDLMLVRLSKPSAQPVAAWNAIPAVPIPGVNLQMVGFGRTRGNDRNSTAEFLQTVQNVARDAAGCQRLLRGVFKADIMLCAGDEKANVCIGDSGGPLFDISTNTIVGVVSYATATGNNAICSFLSGFTRLSAYDGWIRQTVCSLTREEIDYCPFTSAEPTASPVTRSPSAEVDSTPVLFVGIILAAIASTVVAFFLGGWLDPFEESSDEEHHKHPDLF